MKTTVPLYTNGRVSIPKYIREELDIEHGQLVELAIRIPDSETNDSN
jgi:AbrB family looped-hinge helix DNA binding protein